ncbi:MAG: alpha/beta fold hydrolase [Pyrobaculum sp.]
MTKLTRSDLVKTAEHLIKPKLLTVLAIILAAVFIPIPPAGKPVEELNASGSFIVIDGVKIHYVDKGSGDKTFVLLHGFGASVFSWREVIQPLSRHGRVVALDRPGFGLTERADPTKTPYNPYTVEGEASLILRLMKTLNISKAVFIGHSAGAYTALYIASKHPEAVEALVLIAPAWRMREDGLQRFLLSLPLADKYGPLFLRAAVPYLEQILYKAWYNKNKLMQHVVDGYKYPLNARDWDRGLYWLIKYRRPVEIDIDQITAPVLVIHCTQDEIVPYEEGAHLHYMLKNSTLKLLENCGHLPHEEAPEATLEAMWRFLHLNNEEKS